MMEKICRNCASFKYHQFVGSCNGHDTADMYGKCPACENFTCKTKEEFQALVAYENDVLFPWLNKNSTNSQ